MKSLVLLFVIPGKWKRSGYRCSASTIRFGKYVPALASYLGLLASCGDLLEMWK